MKKQDTSIFSLQETHCKTKIQTESERKETNHENTGASVSISDKVIFTQEFPEIKRNLSFW